MAQAKEKKTVKSIIMGGITAGHTVDRILKAVAKDKPESKADASHIKYYAGQMKRDEDITEEVYAKYANKAKPTKAAAKAKTEAKPAKAAAKAKPAAKAAAKAKPVKAVAASKVERKKRAVKKA